MEVITLMPSSIFFGLITTSIVLILYGIIRYDSDFYTHIISMIFGSILLILSAWNIINGIVFENGIYQSTTISILLFITAIFGILYTIFQLVNISQENKRWVDL